MSEHFSKPRYLGANVTVDLENHDYKSRLQQALIRWIFLKKLI